MITIVENFNFLDKINEAYSIIGVTARYFKVKIGVRKDVYIEKTAKCKNIDDFWSLVDEFTQENIDIKKDDIKNYAFTWYDDPEYGNISLYTGTTRYYSDEDLRITINFEFEHDN